MKHKSIPLDTPVELVNIEPDVHSPLISKCQIKVCYVSDEPNRNGSVITRKVAEEMAPTLRGSCIVGHYNESIEDFEEHNKLIEMKNGEIKVKADTTPYGFVDLNADVWFQKFLDDDSVEREYLCTEGYLWTGQFPEVQRVINKGNNQSMELDNQLTDGHWASYDSGKQRFFIINEAVISKLCILGEDAEPCFEGSNINAQFSLEDDNFKNKLFSLMNDIKEILSKGGEKPMYETYAVSIGGDLFNCAYEHLRANYPGECEWCSQYTIEGIYLDGEQKFMVVFDPKAPNAYHRIDINLTEAETSFGQMTDVLKEFVPAENPQFSKEEYDEYVSKKKEEEEEEEKESDSEEEEEEKKKKKEYVLEEIPEYVQLIAQVAQLEEKISDSENQYSALKEEKDKLEEEVKSLREFKLKADRAEKENMINNFYMLSDEDKADVREHIDTYSLDDIESKLSVICVRNKVSFAKEDDDDKKGVITYSLEDVEDTIPSWIKAVVETAKEM